MSLSAIRDRTLWNWRPLRLALVLGSSCALVSGGCGRFHFEEVDANLFRPDAGDAGDADVSDTGTDAPVDADDRVDSGLPDASGIDGGLPTLLDVPNETLLDTGALHSCAGLFGRVYCWGDNSRGQLGDFTTQDRSAPVQLPALSNVVDLQLGNTHSCAITTIGAVYCWGGNTSGQLGDGTTTDRSRATLVTGLEQGARALWVGPETACVRMSNGEIRCWGKNDRGQLGDGTTQQRMVPARMTALTDVRSLALGAEMTCALRNNDSVQCVGNNTFGQLGNGVSSDVNETNAVTVSGLGDVRELVAGGRHLCAVHNDGRMSCWGDNRRLQLGVGSVNMSEASAQYVTSVATARTGATSEHTSCVLDETGVGRCWGGNVAGSATDRAAPTELLPLSGVRAIQVGLRHQCMRLTSNYVHCIGGNDEGQLGNGTRGPTSATAVQVLGLPAPVSGPDPVCGDGFVTLGETCDDGRETARCNANCTLSMCGDGILNVSDGEACETGTDLDAGSCLPDCTLP